MTAGRAGVALARAVAVALVLASVVAPLCVLLVSSLRGTEVVTTDGRTFPVAGPVAHVDGGVRFALRPIEDPDAELTPVVLPEAKVREVRTAWTTDHYAAMWRSERTGPLLWHSLRVSGLAAVLALLLGVPIGAVLARTTLPGRRVLGVLLAVPLLLPPFFAAMGVSDAFARPLAALGLTGGDLQMTSASICFAALLFPIPALLVGRALASVPAGPWESARLLAGPRAARRAVVWPAAVPAALGSGALVFVISLADFAVPDLLGVFLPDRGVAVHVLATEVFLQWNRFGNVGRAVATGAPFALVVLVLFAVALRGLARRGPSLGASAARPRPLARATLGSGALAYLLVGVGLFCGAALPIFGVAAWGFHPLRIVETARRTAGVLGDVERWLEIGVASAVVATAVAVVLARYATRGGRLGRAVVAACALLPLAVPGMAHAVGTLLLWQGVPSPPGALWKPVLALSGRMLPYALLPCWLAMRDLDPRLEEAGRVLGAGPLVRARRIVAPLARRGVVAALLLVLVLALRELDTLVLLESRVLPIRIYDKVHYGKTGDVADLSIGFLLLVALPAIGLALLWRRRGRREAGTRAGAGGSDA